MVERRKFSAVFKRQAVEELLELRLLKLNGLWEQYWRERQQAAAKYAA